MTRRHPTRCECDEQCRILESEWQYVDGTDERLRTITKAEVLELFEAP